MHYQKLGIKYLVVLERGEEIIQTLQSFCQQENIKSGWLSGLGAVDEMTLGYYELRTKQYHWRNFSGDLEVTSLTGNITQLENKAFLHIHTTISNEELQSFGGHLKSGRVGVTLEVLIDSLEGSLSRRFNDEIGLNLIS